MLFIYTEKTIPVRVVEKVDIERMNMYSFFSLFNKYLFNQFLFMYLINYFIWYPQKLYEVNTINHVLEKETKLIEVKRLDLISWNP